MTDRQRHTRIEQELAILRATEQYDVATTLLLRSYGPDLLAFLHSRLRDLGHAREAFAWLAEDLWRGISQFEGRSSVRTWAYAIARNVAHRFAQRELRGRDAQVPISEVSRASALEVHLPSTGLDERLERIRQQLDPDEQMLLTLRVDQEMEWREVALIFLSSDRYPPDEDEVAREAGRLRKRFQFLKEKLRRLAAEL